MRLEESLRKLRGVAKVHLDRTRGVAHVTYEPLVTTAEAIQSVLQGYGYKCDCQSCACSKCQPGHSSVETTDQWICRSMSLVWGNLIERCERRESKERFHEY